MPLLAVPAAAGHSSAVELTAVTSVVTTHSATVDVVLRDDARVSTAPADPGVRFTGRGRLLGLWLDRPGSSADVLTSYRLPAFAGGDQVTYGSTSGECAAAIEDGLPLDYECSGGQEVLLSAGRYRMTVLADGEPIRVTLSLTGLKKGEVTVRPSRRLASIQKPLPVREDAKALVTFGDTADLGGPTENIVVARAEAGDGSVVQESSLCRREDDGATPPLGYGPTCPGGTSGSYQLTVAGMGISGAFASSSSSAAGGPIGLGGSFDDSGGVRFGSALGVWLARD